MIAGNVYRFELEDKRLSDMAEAVIFSNKYLQDNRKAPKKLEDDKKMGVMSQSAKITKARCRCFRLLG